MTLRRSLLALPFLAPLAARAERRGDLWFGKENWLFGAWEDIRRVDLEKVRGTAQLIVQAVGRLRFAGLQVVLTLAPTRARIYADMLPPDFQPSADCNRRYETALQILRRADAVVPDMAAGLLELRRTSQDQLFFKADSHWTPAGAEPMARLTAAMMKDRLRLPASARPGLRLGPVETKSTDGDLMQLLSPADRATYPRSETYRPHRVLPAAGGGGLVEDDSADVAIVGNSYMMPHFGFQPTLSEQLNRPVGLFWKTARFGPYRTLLDYLDSPLFKQSRPKVVVWHLMENGLEYPPSANGWYGEYAMPVPSFQTTLRARLGR